jgi:hypothetical protein
MSREEILRTYKIPALVRAPGGQVDPRGFDTAALTCANAEAGHDVSRRRTRQSTAPASARA